MRAFILTVSGKWRGEEIVRELDELGIPYQVIEGVDGTLLSDEALVGLYASRAARFLRQPLSPREVACAFGHQMLLQSFLETGDEWALMLEDDATLEPEAKDVLSLTSRYHNRPVIVQLQHLGAFEFRRSTQSPSGKLGLIRTPSPVAGAAAYLVNRSAAELALDRYGRRRIDSVADWPFHWKYRVDFYACHPPAAHQRPSAESLIDSDRVRGRPLSRQARAVAPACMLSRAIGLKAMVAPLFGVSVREQWRHDTASMRGRLFRSSSRRLVALDDMT